MDLLEAVAESGVSLLLVGPRHARFELARMQRLLARDNVQWVGPKKFEELPSYLRAIDVGLVPYTDSAFNRGSFPLKTLEYLAAGRGVVATDLPAMRWLDTDLIRVETMATGFANAVVEALRDPRPPAEVARRRAFAAAHSWDRRAEALAEVLGVRPSAAEAPVGSDQDA
jgi:teichuronic acid biosynthesis glycosyltransferase TuaH